MKCFKFQNTLAIAFAISAFTLVGCAITHAVGKSTLKTNPTSTSRFLKQIADIPLTGGGSRFDYQSLDEQSGQLYIAHLGAGQLIAFDTKNHRDCCRFTWGAWSLSHS
jgi:hypothetical protein